MLSDDVKSILNGEFEKSKIPIKINELVIFRPVVHELPFEHIEVINEAKRALECSNYNIVITLNFGTMYLECSLRYKNINSKLQLADTQLQYADIMPADATDLAKFQKEALKFVELLGMLIASQIESIAKEK